MSVTTQLPLQIEGYDLCELILRHSASSSSDLPPVEVWSARCNHNNEEAILKFCRRADAKHQRHLEYVQREAAILCKLNQARIPRLIERFETPHAVGFAMERIPGQTLKQWSIDRAARAATHPPDLTYCSMVTDMGRQLATTIGFVHNAGLVHADIKPTNIIVTPGGVTHLIDFGITRAHDVAGEKLLSDATLATWHDGPVGTLAYCAPELLRGEYPLPQSDVYMLGVVLFELLCGQTPYESAAYSITDYLINTDRSEAITIKLSGIPVGLSRLVAACLCVDPAKRPSNGKNLAQSLAEISFE